MNQFINPYPESLQGKRWARKQARFVCGPEKLSVLKDSNEAIPGPNRR
jgi:hypothetical protein